MQIQIAISEMMTKFGEDGILRLPRDGRDLYNLELNRFLYTKHTMNNRPAGFRIWPAFARDMLKDSMVGYVSRYTYHNLLRDAQNCVDLLISKDVMLGCDPEFFIMDVANSQVISASAIMQHKNGAVGYDGIMGELRPAPALYPEDVCLNLWKLIKETRALVDSRCEFSNRITFVAKSFLGIQGIIGGGQSAGFHLHFGLPSKMIGNVNPGHPKMVLAKEIVKVMDYYVGIPSIILEEGEDVTRRSSMSNPYGKPGAFRMDNRTLEYRVPGGFLLAHPALAAGLIGLGALVVDDMLAKIQDWSNSFSNMQQVLNANIRECYPNIPDAKEVMSIICSPSNFPALQQMDTIINDLSSMPGFDKRKFSVSRFLNCINNGAVFDNNIEANWRSYYHEEGHKQMAVC
jgi:hypothetical protein